MRRSPIRLETMRMIDRAQLDRFRALYQSPVFGAGERLPGARCELHNAADVSELYIYGEIDRDDITAAAVASALKTVKGSTIRVRINSPGGDVFDGIAIYNLLVQRAERIEVWIDSIAASIASVIAMAGDEISIASNAQMMVHLAWGICYGTADDMLAFADLLGRIDETQLIPTYQSKTGLSRATLAEMMEAETWMSADECLANKFADRIIGRSEAKALVRPGAFNHMPASVRESAAALNRAMDMRRRQRLAEVAL